MEKEYKALVAYALYLHKALPTPAYYATLAKLGAIQSFIQLEVNQACDKTFVRNLYNKDAFRHLYWSALMTKFVSEKYAIAIGNAHEESDTNNNPLDRSMDEWNNAIGRKIGKENSTTSLAAIKNLVMNAINTGEAIILRPNILHEQFIISEFRRVYAGKELDVKTSISVLNRFYSALYKDKSKLALTPGSKDYREYNYRQIQQLIGARFILPLKMWKSDEHQ